MSDYVELVEARREMESAQDAVAHQRRVVRAVGTDLSDFGVRDARVAEAKAELDRLNALKVEAVAKFEELRSK